MKYLTLFLIFLVSHSSDSQTIMNYLFEIDADYTNQKYDDGLVKCEKAISLFPNEPDLYCYKALFIRGKDYSAMFYSDTVIYNKANTILLAAIKIDSSHWWAIDLLGTLNYDYKKFDLAMVYYNKSLLLAKRESQIFQSWIGIAATRAYLGDTLGAIEAGKTVIDLDKENTNSYVRLSSIYLNFEYYKRAELILKGALKIAPNNVIILANLGFVCLLTEQFKKAISYYDKVEDLNKNYYILYGNRGYCYLMLGDFKNARKDIKHALKLNPNNPYAYKYRAIYRIKTGGKQADICSDLDQALQLGYAVYDNEVNKLKEEYCK